MATPNYSTLRINNSFNPIWTLLSNQAPTTGATSMVKAWGTDGTNCYLILANKTTWRYNIASNTWTQLATATDVPTDSKSMGYYNGKFYYDSSHPGLCYYDVAGNSHSFITSLPCSSVNPPYRSSTELLVLIRISEFCCA